MSASTPIADYALLADCNSAALVSRAGSVDWLCLPRYDSPALFARLLGPDAGHWSIRPPGGSESEHRYLPGTLVLETTFTTDSRHRQGDRRAGVRARASAATTSASLRPHELLRLVEGVSGTVELELELAPAPRVRPRAAALPPHGRGRAHVRRPVPDRA